MGEPWQNLEHNWYSDVALIEPHFSWSGGENTNWSASDLLPELDLPQKRQVENHNSVIRKGRCMIFLSFFSWPVRFQSRTGWVNMLDNWKWQPWDRLFVLSLGVVVYFVILFHCIAKTWLPGACWCQWDVRHSINSIDRGGGGGLVYL